MKRETRAIGYRFWTSESSGWQYRHLHCQIIIGILTDAAKEYDWQPDEYHLERLQKIRSQGKTTKYLTTSFRDKEFEITWQADQESWDKDKDAEGHWYACKIDNAEFDPDTMAFALKLAKACESCWHPSPHQILAALQSLGVRQVKHTTETPYQAFIFVDEDFDASYFKDDPWDRKPAVEPELETESVGAA